MERKSAYVLFAKLLIISQCAPKLGPVLFDPLKLEISNPIIESPPQPSVAMVTDILRSKSNPDKKLDRPCQGYSYDENNCTLVNNRILCGYDKNVGEVKNKELIVDSGNGCHIRDDRIECGYITGPFEGIRRPPAHVEGKKALRDILDEAPKNKIIMKLKAVSLAASETDRKSPKTKLRAVLLNATSSIVSNESFNLAELADKTAGIFETAVINSTIASIFTTKSDFTHNTTFTSTTKRSTILSSNNSSNSLDILSESTTKEYVNILKSLIKKEKGLEKKSFLKVEDNKAHQLNNKTEFSTKTKEKTANQIRVKRRNISRNKTRPFVILCVEKKNRIICFDDYFLENKS